MEHPLPYWYLAYTKPRQEQTALLNLQQQGFVAYLPLYKSRKRSPQGTYVISHPPMFPRYIFLKPGHARQSLGTIRSTKGLSHLLSVGMEPATIADDIIRGIQEAERTRENHDLSLSPRLRAGTKVRITAGTLAGLEGLVESSTTQRLILLLDILGQSTKVTVPCTEVEHVM